MSEASLTSALQAVFSEGARVAVVGDDESVAHLGARYASFEQLSAHGERQHDAIVVVCTPDEARRMARAAGALTPGGQVLLVCRLELNPWASLRTWLKRDGHALPSTLLAEAALSAGLDAPVVLFDEPNVAIVRARVPALQDPLDAVFDDSTQPVSA